MKYIWRILGNIGFWSLWPLIFVYSRVILRTRVLIIHEQSVLVVKNWLGSNQWALPGGGMHRGESPEVAALREVKEELNLTLEPQALQALGRRSSTETSGLRSDYYLFVVRFVERPDITLQAHEIMDAGWLETTHLLMAPKGVSAMVKDSLDTWSGSQNMLQ